MKSKPLQIAIIIVVDCAIVTAASIIPLWLRFGIFSIDEVYLQRVLYCLPYDMAIAVAVLALFKLYNRVWTFAGASEVFDAFRATLVIEGIYILYRLMFSVFMFRSYYPMEWLVLFFLVAGSRLFVRFSRQILRRGPSKKNIQKALLVGGGATAALLIGELKYNPAGIKILCIVDDNKQKRNKYIGGLKIEGNRYDIPRLAKKHDIDVIIIAIPSASSAEIHDIIEICNQTTARLRILPHYTAQMKHSLTETIRDVDLEDLLGRNPTRLDNEGLRQFLEGKTVLVTGGGGSIGSELCRQILANAPETLLILDIYENSIHDLCTDLIRIYPNMRLVPLVGSVRDEARMRWIFETYRPDIVYHAAAHKHVPLLESSPGEAVKNNCGGILNIARLADAFGVRDFILISTDKAVRPSSVMGATKRVCEMVIQEIGRRSETRFVAVRFGNVLGSNGSVVPLFLRQIEAGGPVTVTHREVTRFFMTIPEAVSLVLEAGLPGSEGELFLLDMGEPVRILDLARNLIKLKGLVPDKDIKIVFTGLRPGEKLFEELLVGNEDMLPTENELIFVAKPEEKTREGFLSAVEALIQAAQENDPDISDRLFDLIDEKRQ